MNTLATPELQSFVLLTLAARRFAMPAEDVIEFIGPQRLHRFPHTTPLLTGVLVRRGRIVPVCDVARVLLGSEAPIREFYLIAKRRFGLATEWAALPVTGECELFSGVPFPPSGNHPAYVSGLLVMDEDTVEILDLQKLAQGVSELTAESRG